MSHSQILKLKHSEDLPQPRARPPTTQVLGMEGRRARLVTDETIEGQPIASTAAPVQNASATSHAPIWQPVAVANDARIPTSSEVLNRTEPPSSLAPELEAAIIATLTRPLAPGESHQTGNAARERELCDLLARLDVLQAHHLGRRLDLARSNDAVAQAFGRLVIERRQRIRAFVADARRRHALAKR